MKRIYVDYDYDLYKNMFNLNFLAKCHSNLIHYLSQLFETKKHCVCFILSNEYHYYWKDWYDGEECRISLWDAIEHKEKHDINKIKNIDFKIKLTKLNF